MQTSNRRYDELAAFVLSHYGEQAVKLAFYEYQLPTLAAIGVGLSSTASLKVSGNADFWMYEGSLYTDFGAANLSVQLVDTGSNEQIASGPLSANFVNSNEIFSLALAGASVPVSQQLILPRRFAMNSTLTFTFTNRSAITPTEVVYSAIRGVLAYPMN